MNIIDLRLKTEEFYIPFIEESSKVGKYYTLLFIPIVKNQIEKLEAAGFVVLCYKNTTAYRDAVFIYWGKKIKESYLKALSFEELEKMIKEKGFNEY